MKKQTSVFGIDFIVNLPFNSVEEYDAWAGKSGACLEDATSLYLAHKFLGNVRSELVSTIEKRTGVDRAYTEEATEKGGTRKTYTETEQAFFKRAIASLVEAEGEAAAEGFKAELATLASNIQPSYEAVRARVSKEHLEAVKAVIAADKVESFCSKLGIDIPNAEGDALAEALAVAYKNYLAEKARAAKADLLG